jgi:hypothetical protein
LGANFNLFGVRAGRGLGGAGPGGSSFLFGPANNLANAPGLELGNLAGRPPAQPEEEKEEQKEEQKQAPPSEPPLPPLSGHNNVGGSFIASANSVIGNAMNIASNAANAAVLGAAVAGAAGSIPLAVTGAMIGAGANSLSDRISNIVFGSSKPRSPEDIEMKDNRSAVRQKQDALLNLESNAQYRSLVASEPIKKGFLGYDKTDAKSKFDNEVKKYKFLHNGKRYVLHRDKLNKETFISEDGDVVDKENFRFRAISQSHIRRMSRLAGLVDEEDINEADEDESEESPLLQTPPSKMQKNFLQQIWDMTPRPDSAISIKEENEPEEKKEAETQSQFMQMTATKSSKEARIKYGHTHDPGYHSVFDRTLDSKQTVDAIVGMRGSKEAKKLFQTADPNRTLQYSGQVPLHRVNREYGLNEYGLLVRLDNPLILHPNYGPNFNVYRPRAVTNRRRPYTIAENINWLNNQSIAMRRRFYQQATINSLDAPNAPLQLSSQHVLHPSGRLTRMDNSSFSFGGVLSRLSSPFSALPNLLTPFRFRTSTGQSELTQPLLSQQDRTIPDWVKQYELPAEKQIPELPDKIPAGEGVDPEVLDDINPGGALETEGENPSPFSDIMGDSATAGSELETVAEEGIFALA